MQQLLPRLFALPLLFAHRGGVSTFRENSLDAFKNALSKGATAIETDLWVTTDGIGVLDHDGYVRSTFRKRRLSQYTYQEVSRSLTSLHQLLLDVPETVDLSIDIKDPAAFMSLVGDIQSIGREPRQIWVCHPEVDLVQQWRALETGVNMVHSTKINHITNSPERHARTLRESGIAVCNMHWKDWSGGLVALYHRFEVACFAWGLEHAYDTNEVLRMGMDGLYADDVSMLLNTYLEGST